jgi:hypothetical protein
MSEPTVDVVIAVHTDRRPISRAVSSVVGSNSSPVRVTVVCHNVDPVAITTNLGPLAAHPQVRIERLEDGIPSPAGPFNHGLDLATAPFTSVLGSDDELDPGAIDSWLAIQARDAADVVIPRIRFSSGPSLRSPQTRPFRSRRLDGARDRLAYRTAQLGLVSTQQFPRLRFATGLQSGEDIGYGLRIWFSGRNISFDRRGPGYVIHDEGADRTSISLKPVGEDFAFLDTVLEPTWIATLSQHDRESIAVKLFRTQVMDALTSRFGQGPVPAEEQAALAAVIRRVDEFAPGARKIVSTRDARLLRQVLAGTTAWSRIRAELAVRTDYRRPSNLLSASPARLLSREAPLRFLGALLLTP